jgi:predicted metal-binding protein
MTTRVTICESCEGAGAEIAAALIEALRDERGTSVATTLCMSGCQRPVTAAFRAPGKTAYLFGELGRRDVAALAAFARAYLASPDGDFADARPFGDLRFKAIARIPG